MWYLMKALFNFKHQSIWVPNENILVVTIIRVINNDAYLAFLRIKIYDNVFYRYVFWFSLIYVRGLHTSGKYLLGKTNLKFAWNGISR